ncbi:hypothetical protein PARPLA_01405 [Rhodobacteraceae bacterium THAF1]|uniref:DUF1194 domain-containing protein n=1 Tax=Palleronia sp. THAF1 TaxID=2587842 RepID=UPI000F3F4825|nr:DUF1194 domain-containing protein [Palleronia sp. THAF1]QFU09413.1 hypothetical protein FIU81_12075 [Palleronia sp. THAF1]VDC21960.1 hypothetical protein PARPLA_01405 [Rhodobacteraceae bacterium THAF1]
MKRLLAALYLSAGLAQAECRQALALGLDISGSVDAAEYRLQLDGLATALDSEAVRDALFAMPGTWVELAVFEWSGPGDVRLTVPVTPVAGPDALDRVIFALKSAERPSGDPSTALGAAMRYGAALLAGQNCWRRTLDISGDGRANTGPRPRSVRSELGDITVNALAIGADDAQGGDRRAVGIAELSAYFRAEVIHGPGAFVETALGFQDYARAMERKLVRELAVVVIGRQ